MCVQWQWHYYPRRASSLTEFLLVSMKSQHDAFHYRTLAVRRLGASLAALLYKQAAANK